MGYLGSSNYVLTDNGMKTVKQLYQYFENNQKLPKVLTYTHGHIIEDFSELDIIIKLNNELFTGYTIDETDLTFDPLHILFEDITIDTQLGSGEEVDIFENDISDVPLLPSSIEIVYSYIDGEDTLEGIITDDGEGNLIGDIDETGTNTIDYETGHFNFKTLHTPIEDSDLVASYVKLEEVLEGTHIIIIHLFDELGKHQSATINTETFEGSFIDLSDLFNTSYNGMFFTDIASIVEEDDVQLLKCRFRDNLLARTVDILVSGDTEIFQYNLVRTTNEPIVNRTFNVFNYISTNLAIIDVKWSSIESLTNYGILSPNLTFSDVVSKFTDRYIMAKDKAYQVLDTNGDPIPVFICQESHIPNFILVK